MTAGEWLRRKRVWIPLLIFAGYTAFGFFAVPPILRGQIVSGIRKELKREARLDRVRFNPLIFSLTLEGFELKDPDGTVFLAYDRVYADLQLSSLVRLATTLREFRVDRPRIHIRLMPDGQPNFADLIPKEEGKTPRLVVGRFQINQGSLRLTNLMSPEPEEGSIEPIDLRLDNFTTIPRKEGDYQIAATDPGGGKWSWIGDLTFEPMHSAGVLEISGSRLPRFWEIVKRRTPFEVTDGQFSCRFQYSLDVHGDSVVARVHDTSLSMIGFRMREKGTGPELFGLDSLVVTGIQVSYPEQSAAIDRVLVAGARIAAWLNRDSSLNWVALMPAPPASAPAASASRSRPDSTAGAAPAAAPWDLKLGELAVRRLGISFEDRTLDPPFRLDLDPANATLRNISSKLDAPIEVASDVTVAGKGRIDVAGTVTPSPTSANLAIRAANLPLPILQPYVNPIAKVHLASGTLGFDGKLQLRQQGATPEASFQGNIVSRDLLVRDRETNDRFVAWKSVAVNGLDFTPRRLRIASVRLREPFAKLLVFRDRTTNVQDILGIRPDSAALAAAEEERERLAKEAKKNKKKKDTAAVSTPAAAAAPVFPVRVAKVEVVDGSADFADFSLILPFAARVDHLNGGVTGLSSDSLARADLALAGTLQPSGTAEVKGQINPLAESPYMDLAVTFRGFNMPVLTPYTGQYLGREVDKGMMSLDLGYQLQGRHLVGQNKVVLDQFELGEKVESPEATHLPVGLALAILKDGEGKIELDVPVEGDVDDPKFRIGKIIWDFIMSLLTKVATAPFALLGALFDGGSGDELSHVDFMAGQSAVPADQQESLTKLSEALAKRPQLGLEVRGRSDADSDAVVIRQTKFAAVAAEKIAADPRKYGGLGYSPVLLEDLCVARLGKPGYASLKERHTSAAGSLPAGHTAYKAGSSKKVVDQPALSAAIQDTLTALQAADAAELLSLATARGDAIKQLLMAKGVDPARVFVLDPEPGKVSQGRIRIDLNLTD